jgi:manganese-dependent inorganic pyrophosphatase
VNAIDEESAKDLAARMKTTMPLTKSSTGMDMSFAMVSIQHDDISVTYLVSSDEEAEEVLQEAFGDTAVFDGTSWRMEPYASRKAVFIPAITDVLESDMEK